MKKTKNWVAGLAILMLWSCQNGSNSTQNSTATATTPTETAIQLEPKYEQAAQLACGCLAPLGDINRRRTTFADQAKFDSVGTVAPEIRKAAFDSLMAMSRNPELKKTALEAWKCFEAQLAPLGELDKAKLDQALNLRCPNYKLVNEQGMNVSPTH